MPELPEMETYRRQLERHCLGQTITGIEVGRPKSLNVAPGALKKAVLGASFTGFGRAGKHLVFQLSSGARLLNHLMLGGAIFYGTAAEAPKRTFQVTIHLENGRALWWTGLRLGWLHLVSAPELAERTAPLGLDPLDAAFTQAHMYHLLHGRRGQLKPLLVDQSLFPGIGNCYSDEICWNAMIHPLRIAGSLQTVEVAQLWSAMRTTLAEAVALGGYTETQFAAGDQVTGGYLTHLKVYDRKDEPCLRCTTPIAFVEAGNRKVFFCPVCQERVNPARPEIPLAEPLFADQPPAAERD